MHRHLGDSEVSRCSRINIRKCPLSMPDERAGLLIIKNAAGGIYARMYTRECTYACTIIAYAW